jgi:RNA polymerase sigma-70 factor (ECF subfamily)
MPITANELTALYREHAAAMVAYLTRRTFDPQIALDLVGETFAIAFEQRDRFTGDAATAGRPWLGGIANNLLNDYFRSGQIEQRAMRRLHVRSQPVGAEEYDRIVELAGLSAERVRVRAALERLAPDHRRAVSLRVVDELSYPEVAQALAVSEQVARARVSRALRKLREILESTEISEVEHATR